MKKTAEFLRLKSDIYVLKSHKADIKTYMNICKAQVHSYKHGLEYDEKFIVKDSSGKYIELMYWQSSYKLLKKLICEAKWLLILDTIFGYDEEVDTGITNMKGNKHDY